MTAFGAEESKTVGPIKTFCGFLVGSISIYKKITARILIKYNQKN
jgi:hypothetical protein